MQLEVSDSEEALNITGDNLSGDEYADRPAVNAYGSPVNVSRIEPRCHSGFCPPADFVPPDQIR